MANLSNPVPSVSPVKDLRIHYNGFWLDPGKCCSLDEYKCGTVVEILEVEGDKIRLVDLVRLIARELKLPEEFEFEIMWISHGLRNVLKKDSELIEMWTQLEVDDSGFMNLVLDTKVPMEVKPAPAPFDTPAVPRFEYVPPETSLESSRRNLESLESKELQSDSKEVEYNNKSSIAPEKLSKKRGISNTNMTVTRRSIRLLLEKNRLGCRRRRAKRVLNLDMDSDEIEYIVLDDEVASQEESKVVEPTDLESSRPEPAPTQSSVGKNHTCEGAKDGTECNEDFLRVAATEASVIEGKMSHFGGCDVMGGSASIGREDDGHVGNVVGEVAEEDKKEGGKEEEDDNEEGVGDDGHVGNVVGEVAEEDKKEGGKEEEDDNEEGVGADEKVGNEVGIANHIEAATNAICITGSSVDS